MTPPSSGAILILWLASSMTFGRSWSVLCPKLNSRLTCPRLMITRFSAHETCKISSTCVLKEDNEYRKRVISVFPLYATGCNLRVRSTSSIHDRASLPLCIYHENPSFFHWLPVSGEAIRVYRDKRSRAFVKCSCGSQLASSARAPMRTAIARRASTSRMSTYCFTWRSDRVATRWSDHACSLSRSWGISGITGSPDSVTMCCEGTLGMFMSPSGTRTSNLQSYMARIRVCAYALDHSVTCTRAPCRSRRESSMGRDRIEDRPARASPSETLARISW